MRKKGRKTQKVTVAYDPRFLDYVYLPINGGKEVITCPLTPAAKTFRQRDWSETLDLFARETVNADLSRNRQMQGNAEVHAIQNHVIETATKETDQAHQLNGKQSKAAQTKNIRGNRAKEKNSERYSNSWKIGDVKDIQENSQFDGSQNPVEIYVPPISNASNIRKVRKLLKGGKNE